MTDALAKRALQRDAQRRTRDRIWSGVMGLCTAGTILIIAVIIGTILFRGIPALTWEFLSQGPTEGMTAGGIWPMIRGTLLLMGGTLLLVLPLGILGGIFLAEYAGQNAGSRLIRGCVMSLAGTPSIVYGLFGLAVFVIGMKLGFSLLAGWMTLTIFILPVIILATENAIRMVPDSLIEGAHALGLSRWQTMRRVVLPHALPGIITGVVLSTGRAAGEAPPILLTAGIFYTTGQWKWNLDAVKKPVENLPYHLAESYRQGGTIPEKAVWGTCLVLIAVILFINFGAILVRAKSRRSQLSS